MIEIVVQGICSLHLRMPSKLEAVGDVAIAMRQFLEQRGLAEHGFAVDLVLRECLNNAVIHGHAGKAGKRVRAALRVSPGWIVLSVRDEGDGFDWRERDGQLPDDESTSGRGLAIATLYAQHVRHHGCGNWITVWMETHVSKGTSAMLNFTHQREGNTVTCTLGPTLTATDVPPLQEILKQERDSGAKEFVFNLAATTTLDSTGIGLLIAAHNSLSAVGGCIRLGHVSPDIYKLLQSMRLVDRLNVTDRE